MRFSRGDWYAGAEMRRGGVDKVQRCRGAGVDEVQTRCRGRGAEVQR